MLKINRVSELFYMVDDATRLTIWTDKRHRRRGRWYEDNMLEAQARLDQDAPLAVWTSRDGSAAVARLTDGVSVEELLAWAEDLDRLYYEKGRVAFER